MVFFILLLLFFFIIMNQLKLSTVVELAADNQYICMVNREI